MKSHRTYRCNFSWHFFFFFFYINSFAYLVISRLSRIPCRFITMFFSVLSPGVYPGRTRCFDVFCSFYTPNNKTRKYLHWEGEERVFCTKRHVETCLRRWQVFGKKYSTFQIIITKTKRSKLPSLWARKTWWHRTNLSKPGKGGEGGCILRKRSVAKIIELKEGKGG